MSVRTPFYAVILEGQDITPWVKSVSITEDDQQADSVSITVPDPRMIYADALFEGSVAEIDLGYSEQHALMIRALISKIEMTYPQDGIPTLTLKGEDKSIQMGFEECNRRFRDRTVTDIVREVAEPYGYAEIVTDLNPDPVVGSRPAHQDGKTDLAFLQDLAKHYHAKCFVELNENGQEVFYFIPERRVLSARRPDRLLLRYRLGPDSNLISFSPSFDSNYIDRQREVHDVDERGEPISNQQQEPGEVFVWDLSPSRLAQANTRDRAKITSLYTSGAARTLELHRQIMTRRQAVGEVSPDQADLESTNDTLQSRRLGMKTTGRTAGNIWLRAKSIVTVEGINARFDGDWYVNNVVHRVDTSGFTTEFRGVR